MLFGAHVSIAGGLTTAIKKGEELGCDVLQIFVSSPQSYRITDYSDEEIEQFKKLYRKKGFKKLFLHSIYLLNLAGEEKNLVDLSVASLIHYLKMGERLGAYGTIFHVGSYKEGSFGQVKKQVVSSMEKILRETPKGQHLIVETAAKGGGRVGVKMSEFEHIDKQIKSERVKFCIDTQHLFASGVDVSDFGKFAKWLDKFDRQLGIKNLVCVHASDSKVPLGSGIDRHENIGEGEIGLEGFKNILCQPLLQDKPFIIETPGFDQQGPDKKNLEILMCTI